MLKADSGNKISIGYTKVLSEHPLAFIIVIVFVNYYFRIIRMI